MSQLQSTGVCDKLCLLLLTHHGLTPPTPPLDGVKIMLFSQGVTPRKEMVLADLTECVFSGYAQSAAVTWNPPVKEADGSYSVSSPSQQFQATAAGTFVGDTIAGVAVVDTATPPNLLYVGNLDEAITINSADQGLNVIVTVNQGEISVNTEITAVS